MSSHCELDAIIARALDGAASGPSDAELIERHPHLAPELQRRLTTLRRLRAAAGLARSPVVAAQPSDDEREELRFLAGVLPEYRFTDRIQMGGQGAVFEATHVPTGRRVAVKLLLDGPLASPTQAERFEREVRVIARLNHPNIITLYDAGVVRGRRYFSMAFVEGVAIDDHAHLHGLGVEDIIRLFVPVCRALAFAHTEGIIHRDIKPSNILVDTSGRPLVLDFGLAKDSDQAARSTQLSITGQVFGTLPYLSPEEVGLDDVAAGDHRTDVYALGVVLYELLTGTYPYPVEGSAMRIRHNILFREPAPLRAALKRPDARLQPAAIPDDLEAILAMALRKDPDHRYASADRLADDLERLLRGEAVSATRDTRLESLRRALRRHRQQVAISLVLAASLAFSSVMWWRAESKAEEARASLRFVTSILESNLEETDRLIEPLAGSAEIRKDLIRANADRLAILESQADSLSTLSSVRGLLFERQGDLAWLEGNREAAKLHYLAFRGELGESTGDGTANHTARLVRAHTKLARVAEDPIREIDKALAIGLPHATGVAADPNIALEVVKSYVELAQLHMDGQHYVDARSAAGKALDMTTTEDRLVTTDPEWTEAIASAYAIIGVSNMALGDVSKGHAALTTSTDIRQRGCEIWPANTLMRHELVISLRQQGDYYRKQGSYAESIDTLKRGITIGSYMVIADPTSARWRRTYAVIERSLSRTLLSSGDYEQARQLAASSVQNLERILEAHTTDLDSCLIAQTAYDHLGLVNSRLSRWDDAEVALARALQLGQQLLDADSESPAYLALVGYSLDKMGTVYRKLDRLDEAYEFHQQALGIREKLLQLQPEVVNRELDLIVAKHKIGTWHMALRTSDHNSKAAQIYSDLIDRLDELHASHRLDGHADQYRTYRASCVDNLQKVRSRMASNSPD